MGILFSRPRDLRSKPEDAFKLRDVLIAPLLEKLDSKALCSLTQVNKDLRDQCRQLDNWRQHLGVKLQLIPPQLPQQPNNRHTCELFTVYDPFLVFSWGIGMIEKVHETGSEIPITPQESRVYAETERYLGAHYPEVMRAAQEVVDLIQSASDDYQGDIADVKERVLESLLDAASSLPLSPLGLAMSRSIIEAAPTFLPKVLTAGKLLGAAGAQLFLASFFITSATLFAQPAYYTAKAAAIGASGAYRAKSNYREALQVATLQQQIRQQRLA